jgi:hydroxymethylpyrimidine/phosphomethylpyrimidine kinase
VKQPPIVLVFAGHDPSGGAGLCADIQTLASIGCHTAPIVTCVTVQDTINVQESIPLPAQIVTAQAIAILNDMTITACKIGLLGSAEIAIAVYQVLIQYPQIPVILDPILAAGGGHSLATSELRQVMIEKLLPLTWVLTPNSQEARALTDINNTLPQAALQLLNNGCRYVVITGTHEETPIVTNTLYGEGQTLANWSCPRLPDSYHGSGCTFASSVAGFLSQKHDIITAVDKAQDYTWRSLQCGYRPGRGQALPYRCFSDS